MSVVSKLHVKVEVRCIDGTPFLTEESWACPPHPFGRGEWGKPREFAPSPTERTWGVHVSFPFPTFTLFNSHRLNIAWMIYLILLSFHVVFPIFVLFIVKTCLIIIDNYAYIDFISTVSYKEIIFYI